MLSNRPLFKDMTGQEINGWFVLSYAGDGKWKCRCLCGRVKTVHGQSLRQARSRSCRKCRFAQRTVEEAFKQRVKECGPDECWPWPRGCGREGHADGYGTLMVHRKPHPAHRVAWEVYVGPIPRGLCVLHRCDNPCCVNPHHLFLGTNVDNIADKVSKGRHRSPRGEHHGNAKLNAVSVTLMRHKFAEGATVLRLSCEFRVSEATVRDIVKGRTWRHLPYGKSVDLVLGKE